MSDLELLSNIKPERLLSLETRRNELRALVIENPFIEATKETEEIARKRRTALLKGRTTVEKEVKLITSTIAGISKSVREEGENLINILRDAENTQQESIDKYDAIAEQLKAEKKRIEFERVSAIRTKIAELTRTFLNRIGRISSLSEAEELSQLLSNTQADITTDEYAEFISEVEQLFSEWNTMVAAQTIVWSEREARERTELVERFERMFGAGTCPWDWSMVLLRKNVTESEAAKIKKDEEQRLANAKKLKELSDLIENEKVLKEKADQERKVRMGQLMTQYMKLIPNSDPYSKTEAELLSGIAVVKAEAETRAKQELAKLEAKKLQEEILLKAARDEAEKLRLEKLKPVKEMVLDMINSLSYSGPSESIVISEELGKVLSNFNDEVSLLKEKYKNTVNTL
jgi:hypothetical protein